MQKKAMSKFSTATILVLGLLLFVHLVQARHEPADPSRESFTHQQEGAQVEEESANEGCGVGVEEEECLMRRTLVAHTDYIYTQGKKH